MYGNIWQCMAVYGVAKVWQWQRLVALAAKRHSRPRTHCQLTKNQVKTYNLTMRILMMMILVILIMMILNPGYDPNDGLSRPKKRRCYNWCKWCVDGTLASWDPVEKVISDFQEFAFVKHPLAMKAMVILTTRLKRIHYKKKSYH